MDSIIMKEALVAPYQERLRNDAMQASRTSTRDRPAPTRRLAQPLRLAVAAAIVMLFAGIMTSSVDAQPVTGWGIDNSNHGTETNGDVPVLESGNTVIFVCLLDAGAQEDPLWEP